MPRQDKVLEKKRGRPSIGRGLQFNSSFRPELAERIDAWIAAQPDPKPSRSEAIRRLVDKALARFKPKRASDG
jgi:metal-responsive CopG/Arc/MetJ family transcriptional regulator